MKKGPVIFRLLSGESVIGNIISENDKQYTVNRPYSINAVMVGETPMNSKEFIFLRDWLKFSIDLSTIIKKNNVLHTSTADPKIIEMYERKMDNDDDPGLFKTENEITDMVEEAMQAFSEADLSELLDDIMNKQTGMDEDAIVEQLHKLKLPITEEFLNDLMALIDVHTDETQTINQDDWDFEDDCPEKFGDPDEFGNHYGHWSIDPEDYL
jgi:hypothetical protein